jgi:N-hydroxyarylamine O-acetyltransferase
LNVNAYLERIAYHSSLAPTAATLRELQVAHLLTVPFENLSIHSGEPIVLADEALFSKIVARRRGGFCYECNGLFAALLRALGFDVTMLSAEVAHAAGGFSQPFDHLALMVQLDRPWLVDVGFGDSFLEPLRLDERSAQIQGRRAYRLQADGNYLILSRRDSKAGVEPANDEWQAQYRFTLQPYQYEDFSSMCRYHQTSPESHFTQGRVCSRATAGGGRISVSAAAGTTLNEMRLTTTSANGERHERVLQSREEYADVLQKDFGVVITATGSNES